VRLTEEKQKRQSDQLGQIESKREDGKGHRQKGGESAASEELGISRTKARRAKKIASISDEAKAETGERGFSPSW
jgi:hypothetical protein